MSLPDLLHTAVHQAAKFVEISSQIQVLHVLSSTNRLLFSKVSTARSSGSKQLILALLNLDDYSFLLDLHSQRNEIGKTSGWHLTVYSLRGKPFLCRKGGFQLIRIVSAETMRALKFCLSIPFVALDAYLSTRIDDTVSISPCLLIWGGMKLSMTLLAFRLWDDSTWPDLPGCYHTQFSHESGGALMGCGVYEFSFYYTASFIRKAFT